MAFFWKKKVGSQKKVSIFLVLTSKEYIRIKIVARDRQYENENVALATKAFS